MKIEEVNTVSEDSEDGDVLLTSSLDGAHLVATDDLVIHD